MFRTTQKSTVPEKQPLTISNKSQNVEKRPLPPDPNIKQENTTTKGSPPPIPQKPNVKLGKPPPTRPPRKDIPQLKTSSKTEKTSQTIFYGTQTDKNVYESHVRKYTIIGNLGAGAAGTVHKVRGERLGQTNKPTKEYALKVAHTNDGGVHIKALENEYNVSNVLTPKGGEDIPGLQSRVKKLTMIVENKEVKSAICHSELMSGNILDSCNLEGKEENLSFKSLSVKKQLSLCTPLWNGLEHIHKKGYLHCDIKPENCLMKLDDNGQMQKIVLADFGGSVKNEGKKFGPSTAHTQMYLTVDDEWNRAEPEDVFALSKTVVELFLNISIETEPKTEEEPPRAYILDSEHRQELKKSLMEESGLPEPVANALARGMGPREGRPTATEMKKVFTEEMQLLK